MQIRGHLPDERYSAQVRCSVLLRHLKQFEKMREQAHAELACEVELGWADLDAGRLSDFRP